MFINPGASTIHPI